MSLPVVRYETMMRSNPFDKSAKLAIFSELEKRSIGVEVSVGSNCQVTRTTERTCLGPYLKR